MSLTDLHANGLYIALYIRHEPPIPNDFHWALYKHTSATTGDTKYHIKGSPGAWIAEQSIATAMLKDFLLVGLFQIAIVPGGKAGLVNKTFKMYDGILNTTSGVTCMTWVFLVLKGFKGDVVKCRNLRELEDEVKEWGNRHAESAAGNVRPRPIGHSKFCREIA